MTRLLAHPHSNENHGDADLIVQARVFNGDIQRNTIENLYAFFRKDLVEAGRVDERHADETARTFVPGSPQAQADFTAALRAGAFGAVTGVPGSGRRTAAIAAIHGLGLPVRPVHVEEDEDWDPAALTCEPNQGYLIDLSGTGPVGERLAQDLHTYAAKARGRDSVVVVVARSDQFSQELPGASVLTVTAPPAVSVLDRHLRVLLSDQDAETLRPALAGTVHGASPAVAARLARLAAATRAAHPGLPFDEWVERTLAAHNDWAAKLGGWFTKHGSEEGVFYRVFLAATALLEHQPGSQVLSAAADLCSALDIPRPRATAISGDGLSLLAREIDAEVTASGRVRFSSVAYAPAVLTHLWTEYPLLRKHLLRWSRSAPLQHEAAWAAPLAVRWLGLAERHNAPEHLTDLFTGWAQSPARDVAVRLAADVARRPRFGRTMRSALYRIATNTASPPALAVAVARVCAAYGPLSLTTALTRLKWLADHEDPDVRSAVLLAVEDLSTSPQARSQILAELVAWAAPRERRGRAALGRTALEALLCRTGADGVPLLLRDSATAAEKRRLADAWHLVFDGRDSEAAAHTVGVWLAPLLAGDVDQAVLAEVLGDAAGRSYLRLIAAERAIDQWAAAHGAASSEPVVGLRRSLLAAAPLNPDGEEP